MQYYTSFPGFFIVKISNDVNNEFYIIRSQFFKLEILLLLLQTDTLHSVANQDSVFTFNV